MDPSSTAASLNVPHLFQHEPNNACGVCLESAALDSKCIFYIRGNPGSFYVPMWTTTRYVKDPTESNITIARRFHWVHITAMVA